ncbi:MAG TPA: hypothetical protein VHF02_11075 [Luteimonas sp.]|nr:hypothetical protein [Luteimonas sp.]
MPVTAILVPPAPPLAQEQTTQLARLTDGLDSADLWCSSSRARSSR